MRRSPIFVKDPRNPYTLNTVPISLTRDPQIVSKTGQRVSDHYDRLDSFYRSLWGAHVHHGLWSDSSASVDEAVRHLAREVARDGHAEKGTRICDIGCGYGAPARLWADEYGADVSGYTVSNAQVRYARRQTTEGPGPEYKCKDFLENELADGSMDVAVAIESLTHIRDPARVLKEVARILRPGGRFVACVWMARPGAPEWSQRHLLRPIRDEGRLTTLPTATQLHRWAQQAGLTVERLHDRTGEVRRTWVVVVRRFVTALLTDPSLLRTLLDTSESERVFARTIFRILLAQHLGVLRYGWLVASRP